MSKTEGTESRVGALGSETPGGFSLRRTTTCICGQLGGDKRVHLLYLTVRMMVPNHFWVGVMPVPI